jgi:DNA-3-methyladenine glycosylase II
MGRSQTSNDTRTALAGGSCEVCPQAPYDLSLAARFFARRSVAEDGALSSDSPEQLTLYTVLKRQPLVIKATNKGTIGSPELAIHWRELVWSVGANDAEELSSQDIIMHLRKVLSLDLALKPFYGTLARCECLKGLAKSLRGLKPTLTSSCFDAAMWAIVGQQVTLGFALTLKERLARRYGRQFDYDGKEMFSAPTAGDIASADVSSLRLLQLSQRKAEYALTLARAVTEGAIDLEALRSDSYESACEKLVALRGIGKWTANYILMRGAGHLDALPLGDAGLRRAVRNAYGLKRPPSDDEIAERAEPFRPCRSLYTLYLWQGFA